MARYDMTTEATTLIERGLTADQITARTRVAANEDGEWIAYGRSEERAFYRLLEETPAAGTTTAAKLEPLATPAQVALIKKLIRQGRHTEGGFYNGPTTTGAIRGLTTTQAAAYIDSLTGQY